MASFNVVVDHNIHRDVAVTKLRTFSDQLRDQALVEVTEVEEFWDDMGNLNFAFKAMGFKISGSMVTCTEKITVIGSLPFAALPFRGAIESQIAEKVKQAIG